ncbi:enoyl-CoA hydratase [Microaerobacter geothermalis]|uniref:enoyl-CoA hydratase n=1 Tax=Microaerobacter geothermalis TaxID=674972 RepID=UPI001F35E460|nr:enoyl-CoA hydratase [Microaerobacter geothermalis]MCF6092604.1 enoyl-CoA hydratase [Microaerobacter geothermalis]
MGFTNVKVEIVDSIAKVIVDNPPANTLSTATLKGLDDAISTIEANDQVKVIIITGAGKFFVAGADIKEFTQVKDGEQGEAMARVGQQLVDRIENLKKPVIAAINGACLGGGLELAMACHIRVSAHSAKLGLPELNLGLIPGFGGTQRLPRIVGFSKATELILTSEMVSGEQAEKMGLVNYSVPLEELENTVQQLAEKIAGKSSATIALALEAIAAAQKGNLQEGLIKEAALFGKAFTTEDQKEGVQAFIEKRPPQFKNR